MSKVVDLTGQRFGSLTVIERAKENTKAGKAKWLCKCDCGNMKIITGGNLRSGEATSCGCHHSKLLSERNYKHGLSETRLHHIWTGIKERCTNKNCEGFPLYGGRGIKMCDEWKNDFYSFYTWAIQNGYRDDLTIDRIDVNGNYEPSNCRWATVKEQARNKRNNVYVLYKGRKITILELSKITGINIGSIRNHYAFKKKKCDGMVDFTNWKPKKRNN